MLPFSGFGLEEKQSTRNESIWAMEQPLKLANFHKVIELIAMSVPMSHHSRSQIYCVKNAWLEKEQQADN